jgi:ankyrin repeat protein
MMNRINRLIMAAPLVLCLALPAAEACAQQKAPARQNAKASAPPAQAQLNAALANAVRSQNPDRVADLLKRGADPNATSEGAPLLIAALSAQSAEGRDAADSKEGIAIFTALLTAGAKPDVTDKEGNTPLGLAAAQGYNVCCKLLLANHASVDLPSQHDPTPLMLAVAANQEETVALLLAHKADLNARTKDGLTPLAISILSSKEDPLETIAPNGLGSGMKPLMAPKLIDQGADLKAKRPDGTGLLTFAAGLGNLRAARLLLAKGADINERNKDGLTPLLIAAIAGKTPMVRFLLANGADPKSANNDGLTPLAIGVHNGSFAVVQMLLAKGANASAKIVLGFTALKAAREQKMTALIKLLTAAGAKE